MLPKRVTRRDKKINPHNVVGVDKHRSSPTAPAYDIDPGRLAGFHVDDIVFLCAPEHQRPVDRVVDDYGAPGPPPSLVSGEQTNGPLVKLANGA